MTPEERETWLDHLAELDEPADLEEEEDPEDCEPLTAEELTEVREAAEAGPPVWAGMAARRGPGQPGSARTFPGESCSPAASFGSGMALDVMPACPGLALSADAAAGDDDSYAEVSDDELLGVLAAWDRLEAHMAARKLAAVAELIRRSPAPGCAQAGPGRMPEAWDEFAGDELATALAESRAAAEGQLNLAWDLAVRLPGTVTALRDGILSRHKAQIIAHATALLDPAEARAAEQKVLDRAGRLTPGGLRAAMPARPPAQAAPQMARRPAPRRHLPVDHPGRAHLRHRTHPLPHLTAAGRAWSAFQPVTPRADLRLQVPPSECGEVACAP